MKVLIVDFGAERLDLLSAAMEKFGVDYEIVLHGFDLNNLGFKPQAVILSGSLHCSYLEGSPDLDFQVFNLGVPILGICYGMQLTALKFGGRVEKAPVPEEGPTKVEFLGGKLTNGLTTETEYMTHFDMVTVVPKGFTVTGKTADCPVASMENLDKNIYCVQFHPEFFISHSDTVIFENFLYEICGFPRS